MRSYQRARKRSRQKEENRQLLDLQAELPMEELVAGLRYDIEAFSAQVGLKIIQGVLEEEVSRKTGRWGSQVAHRHGTQPGYVVFSGRKVPMDRPRVRERGRGEVALSSYGAFQSDGKMQKAVERQLTRQCSTRDYEGAIEEVLDGYGIKKSSVSRHWKVATALELEKLCQRPVPKDVLALFIDSQYFAQECITVVVGVNRQGKKQVLGLWHGATENSTVVKALLEELVERGLESQRKLLIVIDGAKALRKAVTMVLGDRAVVQRCRVHKQRNVVEHLPREKQQQAIWRLRAAWAKEDAKEAEKELRQVVRWLEPISPMAARSLEEGLEETLTLQTLGINPMLCQSMSSTNLIESCFSRTQGWTRRVKRWRGAKMILRWSAAALLTAEKGFRKVRGFRCLPQLEAALNQTKTREDGKAA
jgi:transposase-like protein